MKIKRLFTEDLRRKLRKKYKFVIINNATFEEKFSLKLTPLFVLTFVSLLSMILIVVTILLITFTSLREYIPGYGSTKQSQRIAKLQLQTDSLQQTIYYYDTYLKEIQKVFVSQDFSDDTLAFQQTPPKKDLEKTFAYSKEDSLLMDIASQKKQSETAHDVVISRKKTRQNAMLFVPTKGQILSRYNPKENQLGIAFSITSQQAFYAIAGGNVVFSGKTSLDKNTIIIHHPDAIISIYKNVSKLLVNTGDVVKAGQVIGFAADAETESPVMEFELWINGNAVNPEKHINF